MKLTLKLMLYICILMSFPVFLLQILRLHALSVKHPSTTPSSFSACKFKLEDETVRTKLIPNITKMTEDEVDAAVKIAIRNCELDYSTLSKFKIRTWPSENHFLYYSPRLLTEKNSGTKSSLPLCPAESPLMQGSITVDIAGECYIIYKSKDRFSSEPNSARILLAAIELLLLTVTVTVTTIKVRFFGWIRRIFSQKN